jgi:hypothetical protein
MDTNITNNWRAVNSPPQSWECSGCSLWMSPNSGWTAYYNEISQRWLCDKCYTSASKRPEGQLNISRRNNGRMILEYQRPLPIGAAPSPAAWAGHSSGVLGAIFDVDQATAERMTAAALQAAGMVTGQLSAGAPGVTMPELATIAAGLDAARQQRTTLTDEIDRLTEEGLCNGHRYYRKLPSGGAALYANHTAGQSCPLHGQPPADGRLRAYAGLDTGPAAAAVMAAMQRWQQVGSLTKERHGVQQYITQTEGKLSIMAREAARMVTD